MAKPLIECIPNFSEARRPEVIEAILSSIKSVAEVRVLDRHSDMDHNRTVITMVGSPASIEEAAFLAISKAQELIDLEQHQGAHPRIGATDVVPFVPIAGVSMTECVELARRLGKRVGDQLSIPVYLYEEAATTPERQNLEYIRKGQYEGLKEEIGSVPERKPDFGPSELGSAGATVIGARAPLIAFNIYLTTSDPEIAQKDRQGGAQLIRWSALCKRHGNTGGWDGAGIHEPDEFQEDANPPGGGDGAPRSTALRSGYPPQRACWIDPSGSPGGNCNLVHTNGPVRR